MSRAVLKFTAASQDELGRELKSLAAAHLAQTSDHRWADFGTQLKALLLLVGMALFLVVADASSSPTGFFFSYLAACLLAMAAAMNLLHDAAHGAFFRHGRWNRWAMRLCALPLGVDTGFWTIRHVHFHHSYANIEGHDLDIEPNAVLRQTPFQPWQPRYRFQHLYWPLVAALSLPYLNWYADFQDVLGRTPVRPHARQTGWKLWVGFGLAKAAHLGLMLALPMVLLMPHGISWAVVLAAYLCGQMLASCGLVALILGTHWADVAFYRSPAEGRMPHSWHAHAFYTSCDWQPRPLWLGGCLGGLHLHLTHHLFPTYCHRHYPALALAVHDLALMHGLPYRCLSYAELLQAQQRFLRAMGQRQTA